MNMYLLGAFVFWVAAWGLNIWLSNLKPNRAIKLAVPVIFGVTILVIWELVVRGLEVSPVLLPPPSMIGVAFVNNMPILWADFVQTIIKGALSGYVMGCGAAFLTAIAIGSSGAALPVHILNASKPWPRSITSPGTDLAPTSLAVLTSWVAPGL